VAVDDDSFKVPDTGFQTLYDQRGGEMKLWEHRFLEHQGGSVSLVTCEWYTPTAFRCMYKAEAFHEDIVSLATKRAVKEYMTYMMMDLMKEELRIKKELEGKARLEERMRRVTETLEELNGRG
jgi:hypothetical protein